MTDQYAMQDQNKFPALLAHTGTAGTAETVRVTCTDGALDVDIVGGEIIASLGTVDVVKAGSVVVTAGTIGDLDTVGTVGVLNDGSVAITALPDLPGGTVDAVSSVANLAGGSVIVTAGTIGDLDTVGTVGVLNDGSVAVTALPDLPGGTVDLVTSVSNLAAGTISILTNGTVAVKNTPPTAVLVVSALGTAAAAAFGTLSAASGAGTSHVVSGCAIVVHSGTVDCYLGYGTALTGGSVLARGQFVPGGGIARDFSSAISSGTNSEICYWLGGTGTAFFGVNYWKE